MKKITISLTLIALMLISCPMSDEDFILVEEALRGTWIYDDGKGFTHTVEFTETNDFITTKNTNGAITTENARVLDAGSIEKRVIYEVTRVGVTKKYDLYYSIDEDRNTLELVDADNNKFTPTPFEKKK